MTAPQFKNGEVATDYELDTIARAFGFMSHQEMERVMRAGDEKRRRRRVAAGGSNG